MKDIVFIGNSLEDLRKLPKKTRQEAGRQLMKIQYGVEPNDWKPMPTIGKGVKEIRIHTDSETRIMYAANFEDAIYVIHAFQKKTQKTSRHDIETARRRFKQIKR